MRKLLTSGSGEGTWRLPSRLSKPTGAYEAPETKGERRDRGDAQVEAYSH